jgi:glycosyltransferase involved in cell wall biosynthesis
VAASDLQGDVVTGVDEPSASGDAVGTRPASAELAQAESGAVLAVTGFPPKLDHPNGFSARANRLLTAVARRWPLDVVAVHAGDADWTADTFLPDGFPVRRFACETPGPNPLNAAGPAGAARRAMHYLAGRLPYGSHPRRLRTLDARLRAERPALGLFFLPHTEHLSLALPPGVPAICVVEEGFERAMDWTVQDAGPLRRLLIAGEHARIASLHRRVAARGGRFVVISDTEADWLARSVPPGRITVIPHGVDCGYFAPMDAPAEHDVAVFGQLGEPRVYEPAVELYARMRDAGLRWAFVGRNPALEVAALASPQVTVTGMVPDVRPFYARSRVALVPTRIGTGVKTTVLQAWAMGRPVVATPFALTGLPARPGENVLVGETADELAAHVAGLLASPDLAGRVGDAGLRTVREERDTRLLAERFADLCAEAMESQRG